MATFDDFKNVLIEGSQLRLKISGDGIQPSMYAIPGDTVDIHYPDRYGYVVRITVHSVEDFKRLREEEQARQAEVAAKAKAEMRKLKGLEELKGLEDG